MQETQVQFLGWEDPLEKEMVIHSSIIAWKIPWTEEPGGLQSMGVARVRHDLATKLPNHHSRSQASLIAQLVKNPPAIQENLV